jgi:hypothetical protein
MNDLRFGAFNSGRDKLVLWDQITLRSAMKRSHKHEELTGGYPRAKGKKVFMLSYFCVLFIF